MKFVINACKLATILHRKLGLVFTGFGEALEYHGKFVIFFTTYSNTRIEKLDMAGSETKNCILDSLSVACFILPMQLEL